MIRSVRVCHLQNTGATLRKHCHSLKCSSVPVNALGCLKLKSMPMRLVIEGFCYLPETEKKKCLRIRREQKQTYYIPDGGY